MAQDGAKVALCAGGHKQRCLKPQQRGDFVLQGIDRRVVAKHVVSQRGRQHGLAHGRGRLGHGVTAKVNDVHKVLAGVRGSANCSFGKIERGKRLKSP